MAKPKRASVDDVIRLGQQVADVKAGVSAKVWRHLVNTAHAQGYTVGGVLSGQPNALKERTRTSLKKQAESTVAQAYAPGEKQLDEAEKRTMALDEKRRNDNTSYERWLATQTAQMDAQGRAADKQINDVAAGVQQQSRDAWAAAEAGAKSTAAASPGNVSDPNQSNALRFGAERAAQGAERTGAAAAEANAGTSAGEAARVMVSGALTGQMQASKIAQQSKTQEALQGIVDDRTKLSIQRAGAAVNELSRLSTAETDKAFNTANLNVAAEKLGVQRDELTAATLKANADRGSRDTNAKANRALRAAEIAISKGKADLNGDGKVDVKDYKLKAKIDAGTTSSKPTEGAVKNSQAQYQKIASAADEIARLHKISKQDPSTFRRRLMELGFSSPQIDVANSLYKNGGKLTPNARKIAVNLGIRFPEKLWGQG